MTLPESSTYKVCYMYSTALGCLCQMYFFFHKRGKFVEVQSFSAVSSNRTVSLAIYRTESIKNVYMQCVLLAGYSCWNERYFSLLFAAEATELSAGIWKGSRPKVYWYDCMNRGKMTHFQERNRLLLANKTWVLLLVSTKLVTYKSPVDKINLSKIYDNYAPL